MISDLDIFRAANLLVKQYGDEAPNHAAARADDLLDSGDLEGQTTWERMLAAIEELLNHQSPAECEAIH